MKSFKDSKDMCSNDSIPNFIDYKVNPRLSEIKFFSRNENGILFGSINNLESWLRINGKKLVFAINGGIYDVDSATCGLYIENYKELKNLNTGEGNGNFYLKPNGIFYITKNKMAYIRESSEYQKSDSIIYAIQSGPLLIQNGNICKSFENFTKRYIRNAAGILSNGDIIFTISTNEITITELARHLKELGCINALYLDGVISDIYIKGQLLSENTSFFVTIIGIIE